MRRSLIAAAVAACLAATLGGCASHGREVFVSRGCASCHRFRDAGGGMAPDLTDVASRRDPTALRLQVTDPASATPGGRMPAFKDLSWFELESLVAYLRSRP